MSEELRLQMRVSDLILYATDCGEDLLRTDLEGVAMAKAIEVIELVRLSHE